MTTVDFRECAGKTIARVVTTGCEYDCLVMFTDGTMAFLDSDTGNGAIAYINEFDPLGCDYETAIAAGIVTREEVAAESKRRAEEYHRQTAERQARTEWETYERLRVKFEGK
jgi:hypothetical protein